MIPFVTGGLSKNYEDEKPQEIIRGIGGDVKVGITPSLNLDLTFNPDFSQVEVDRQVANLDRFEITFPERRQFFLENNDLFSDFGSQSLRPFFTRRIGIAKDTVTNEIVANQIIGGARLSGKLDKNWRVGLLNIQTARDQGYTGSFDQLHRWRRAETSICQIQYLRDFCQQTAHLFE